MPVQLSTSDAVCTRNEIEGEVMAEENTIPKWQVSYWEKVNGFYYGSIVIALTSLFVSAWAVIAGLNQVQDFLSHGELPFFAKEISNSIAGVKLQLSVTLMLAIRLLCIGPRKKTGHIVALLALVTAVSIFSWASVWSNQALREMNQELERQNIMTGFPPFFIYGTSPYCVLLVIVLLFLSITWELSILIVSYLQRNKGKEHNP